MARWAKGLAACLALLMLGGSSGRATGLVADLSHHLIAITTAFTGSDVLLFGAIEEPGGDVAMVVRGPLGPATVRRKDEVGFVWLNLAGVQFEAVPAYYAVAASKPLDLLADEDELRRHGIGVDNLELTPVGAEAYSEEEREAFRQALIRNKQEEELYGAGVQPVRFLGDSLFRTTISFPANVPPGNYHVEVFHFRDGAVVGAQTSVLIVSKVGLEADIYDIAQNHRVLYGLASILLAISAGWTASVVFRK